MRGDEALPIYQKQVVFIFDECHRSQFGEAQKNLTKKFKKFYQFELQTFGVRCPCFFNLAITDVFLDCVDLKFIDIF